MSETLDLVPYGYAPGNYMCRCKRCTTMFAGDKRAIRCEECAKIVADALSEQSPIEKGGD